MTAGVVLFVVALLLSIMLHEAGHFATAKRFGMKASQFFIGFGPTLWSVRRGETEYGVKAIPAGGFVKIVGMTDLEEIDPADADRAFFRAPAWQRAIVLAAGSAVHFLIALVLLFCVYAVIGIPALSPTVSSVARCLPAAATTAPTASACAGLPASPAAAAGLHAGDRIVAVDGHRITSWTSLTSTLARAGAGPASVTVVRDGHRLTRRVVLAGRVEPVAGHPGRTHRVGVLGVTGTEVAQRSSPLSALAQAGSGFGTLVTETFSALGNLPHAVSSLFHATLTGARRSDTGLVGPVGIARASAQALGQPATPLFDRVGSFILIITGLNVFVGIFNLLPLLPLDGGHLAVLGYEQARRGVYRVAGRRDPGRVDLRRLLPAAYLVMALFIGLSVLLLFADIVNPIANPFGS